MPWYLKLGIWLGGGLICTVIGLIPVGIAYWLYHLINPQGELVRLATVALMLVFGGGGTLALWGFLFIAMLAWTGAILDE